MTIIQALSGGYKSATQGVASIDPYFTSVVLLLHLNSSLNDSSQKAAVVTSSGTTPAFTTTGSSVAPKVGSGALTLVAGTRLLVPATNMSFTGDFTIECWAYLDYAYNPAFLDTIGSASSGYQFFINKGSTLSWYYNGSSTISGAAPAANTWNHYAVSRVGSTLRLFLNGTMLASATVSGTISAGQTNMAINYQQSSGPIDFTTGYIDEIRITNGVGRYTANFTPSTIQSLAYLTSGSLIWAIPNASPLSVATKTLSNASSYISGVTLDDQTGWRMPTVAETQAFVAQYGAAYLRSVGWPSVASSYGWIGDAYNSSNEYIYGMDSTSQGTGTPVGFSYASKTTDSYPGYYVVKAA